VQHDVVAIYSAFVVDRDIEIFLLLTHVSPLVQIEILQPILFLS
jgi:hypothetical protein